MATREENTGSFVYLTVKHHSIVEESKDPKPNFEPVQVTNPKTKEVITKYIDKYGGITGYVENIEIYDTEQKYDTRFQGFKINLDNEVILDLPHKTPSYDAFCRAAENIDFTQPVTFSAYHNRAKDRTGFSIKQNGVDVEWNYTKDNPGDCPQWEKNDDDEWDSSKQRAFLKKQVREVVVPAVKLAADARRGTVTAVEDIDAEPAPVEETKTTKAKAKAATAAVDPDDIPF